MTKDELEKLNKEYFGNTMEQAKTELGKELVEKWNTQNKIKKAIKFINKYKFKGNESIKERYLDNNLCDELLDILQKE